MENAIILSKQIIILFMLAMFGFFLQKKGVFSVRGTKQLSNFVIKAVTPFLIFTSFQKEFDKTLASGLLMSFLLALISHIILVIIPSLILRCKDKNYDTSVEKFSVIYSNCGFLGIPLVNSIYGSEGVFYVTAYIAVFNIFCWTHGVFLMTGKKDIKSVVGVIKSPAIMSVFIGIICFVFGIMLPDILLTPMNYISSLNTPLTLIVSGAMIAQSNLLEAFKKKRIYLCVFLRLLALPLIIMFVYSFFDASEIVVYTMLIAASAPTAASTIMFANSYHKDAVYASEIFGFNTALSIFTMPFVMILADFVLK